jgi:hypothetical protein
LIWIDTAGNVGTAAQGLTTTTGTAHSPYACAQDSLIMASKKSTQLSIVRYGDDGSTSVAFQGNTFMGLNLASILLLATTSANDHV